MRVYAVLLSVLAVLLGIAAVGSWAPRAGAVNAGVPDVARAAVVAAAAAQETGTETGTEATPEPGPELDPQTEAEAEKDRSRLVVGVIAAALLGIVVWGRWVRSQRGKKG